MIEWLSAELQNVGYYMLIFLAPVSTANVDQVVREIMDYQVDGIVMASVSMSSDLAARCQATGIPVVLFNRAPADKNLSSVTSDNFACGKVLADYICSLGHQRMAYVAGFAGASTQIDREAGFRAGLAEAGQTLFARAEGKFDYKTAQAAARALFATSKRPDAVFVSNDHKAFAVMDVLRFELGLKVPDDVSVVGFDDVPPAAWSAYNLTTFRQRVDQMVAETVSMLTTSIAAEQPNVSRVVLAGELVIRGSTRLQGRAPQDEVTH